MAKKQLFRSLMSAMIGSVAIFVLSFSTNAFGEGMSKSDIKNILSAHNCYRAAHGVPALKWNDKASKYAQDWVSANGFTHSDSYESDVGPLGENLVGTTGALEPGDMKRAARMWYSEVKDYTYGSEYTPGIGHFTAMIWKGAKYLGCGVDAKGVIMCNYWSGKKKKDCSTPNMGGCFAEQVVRPTGSTSNCP